MTTKMIFIILTMAITAGYTSSLSPHVVLILADDMGWRDVSFHGSDQILTPNIDALAYHSIILQHYYTEPICTPARSSLLTGKYAWKLGMQGLPLLNSEDRGIPLSERLLPSYFKDLGYSTHLIGKWHVGMSSVAQLPTSRGFDSHYGVRGGFVDYYTYNKVEDWPSGEQVFGLDLYDGMEPQTMERRYIVDAFTDRALKTIHSHDVSKPMFLKLAYTAPHAGNDHGALQTPPGPIEHAHIAHTDRRLYAQMVAHVDESIGKVVRALAEKAMLNDTIIVFASDNGAPTIGQFSNCGLNLPLRGIKRTPWEGAVRAPAFVWHSSFKPRVWNGLIHITDWLPTLLAAAGHETDFQIDGINQWDVITQNKGSKRNELVVTIDDLEGFAAYRLGDYKIVIGNLTGTKNEYPGEMYLKMKKDLRPPEYIPTLKTSEVAKVFEKMGKTLNAHEVTRIREQTIIRETESDRDSKLCIPTPDRGCLYNLRQDPTEHHDLWDQEPQIVNLLRSRLQTYSALRKPRLSLKIDKRADPANFNYIWHPWHNCTEDIQNPYPVHTNDELKTGLKEIESTVELNTYLYRIDCSSQLNHPNFLCLFNKVDS